MLHIYQIILQFNAFAAAFLCTIRTQSLLLIALAAWPALAQLSQPLAARALLSGHAAGKSAWRASSRLLASPHRAPTSSAATLAASLTRRRRGERLAPQAGAATPRRRATGRSRSRPRCSLGECPTAAGGFCSPAARLCPVLRPAARRPGPDPKPCPPVRGQPPRAVRAARPPGRRAAHHARRAGRLHHRRPRRRPRRPHQPLPRIPRVLVAPRVRLHYNRLASSGP